MSVRLSSGINNHYHSQVDPEFLNEFSGPSSVIILADDTCLALPVGQDSVIWWNLDWEGANDIFLQQIRDSLKAKL